ncbi:MAG: hypothetical protein V3S20_04785 [Dehalococcoidia bacterium]
MKRTVRHWLPVVMLAAALVAAGVLFVTRSGNEPTEAVIQVPPKELGLVPGYRFCDVSLETFGRDVRVFARIGPTPPHGHNRPVLVLVFSPPLGGDIVTDLGGQPTHAIPLGLTADSETGVVDYAAPSTVVIDARTGELVDEFYSSVNEEVELRRVLRTLEIGMEDPTQPGYQDFFEFECR